MYLVRHMRGTASDLGLSVIKLNANASLALLFLLVSKNKRAR